MNRFVYLDNNATTKVSNQVQEKIAPYINHLYGNPSSIYQHGVKVKLAIEEARKHCAKLLGCDSENVVFTSGGSEGNASAFNYAVNKFFNKKKIITTKVEHSSIMEQCKFLETKGYEVIYLDVDANCQINTKQLDKELDDNVAIVSIQYANNETGAIIVNEKILKLINNKRNKLEFIFHIDAVQGLGKVKLSKKILDADVLSFSGHKIHALKGSGFMYLKYPNDFVPLIFGHQERGLRGGTENVVGIIGIGEACKYIYENIDTIISSMEEKKRYLENELESIPGVTINCKNTPRIGNTCSVIFDGIEGNNLLFKLEYHGVCISTGSACNSESSQPSHVLVSMGVKNPKNAIRISLDENTSKTSIDYFLDKLKAVLNS